MQRVSVVSYLLVVIFSACLCCVMGVDLDYTPITTVTDETRYTTLHPDATLLAFKKVRHVKGNYFFSLGERITGDALALNFLDKATYTKEEDIEVFIKYPAKTGGGVSLTAMEIYADLTSDNADAHAVDGAGINESFVQILLSCNQTRSFTYELFLYGY